MEWDEYNYNGELEYKLIIFKMYLFPYYSQNLEFCFGESGLNRQ